MAILDVQNPSLAGQTVTFDSAATGGDSFPNDGRTYVHVKNTNSAERTLTFESPTPCSFGVTDAAHDEPVDVSGNTDEIIGPFPKSRFNDDEGRVQISYSATAGVTVAVIRT